VILPDQSHYPTSSMNNTSHLTSKRVAASNRAWRDDSLLVNAAH
jgi:hypothetical protein